LGKLKALLRLLSGNRGVLLLRGLEGKKKEEGKKYGCRGGEGERNGGKDMPP